MIPVIVISLTRSADRRRAIAAHLGGNRIPFRLLDAIDGTTLSADARTLFDPTMPIGAMGCVLSHLAALREIAHGPDEFACVLEDDARLVNDASTLLCADTLNALAPFDVLRLESTPRDRKRLAIKVAHLACGGVFATYRPTITATGQIISRRGAAKIVLSLRSFRYAIDAALYLESEVFGLRILEIRPSIVTPDASLVSLIGQGREPHYPPLHRFANKRLRWRETKAIASFVAAWRLRALRVRPFTF